MDKESTIKKGKILDALVAMLEKALSNNHGTVIQQNKKIIDEDGIEREIDVYVEFKTNKRKTIFIIECKNYNEKNKVQIDEIEAFSSKCQKLNANHKIFVTASGYQKGAIIKAKSFGIELIELEEQVAENFSEEFDIKEASFFNKHISVIKATYFSKGLSKEEPNFNQKNIVVTTQKNKKLNRIELENEIMKSCNSILFQFLETKDGILLNHAKLIKVSFRTENLNLFYKRKYYKLDSLYCLIEIELKYQIYKPESKLLYKNVFTSETYATLFKHDFVNLGTRYSFSFVKQDDESPKFYLMQEGNSDSIVELSDLGQLNNASVQFNDFEFPLKPLNTIDLSYQVSESFIESVKKDIGVGETRFFRKPTPHNLLVTVTPKENKLRIMNIEKIGKQLFAANLPNPVSLLMSYSIEQFNESESQKNLFPRHTEGTFDSEQHKVKLLSDYTYFKYIQRRIGSILSLQSGLVALFNFIIPGNIEVVGNDIFGKEIKLTKSQIEKEFSFEQKLRIVIENSVNVIIDRKMKSNLLEIDSLCKIIQNLESSNKNGLPSSIDSLGIVLKADIKSIIESAIEFVKKVSPDSILSD